MTILDMQWQSRSLEKWTTVRIFRNPRAEPPYPVLYLLHGLGGHHLDWTRHTLLERYALSYPFLIVMPDGARAWYADSPLGRYETALADELVGFVDATFRTRAERTGRAVGGLSMGGYGALKFGLKHSGRFASVTAHSGALMFAHHEAPTAPFVPEIPLFREHLDPERENVYDLARACPPEQRPAIRIDCGRQDFLFEENEAYHAFLDREGVPHEYHRFDGTHDWAYWNARLPEALAFHADALGVEPLPPAEP